MNDALARALKQHGSIRIGGRRLRCKQNVSPHDPQPYVGRRWLQANCIEQRGCVFVLVRGDLPR
ncbi:MAG: hypothetical protein GIW99_01865 [Candidatus Eremiobacteraeota bacterium]|nr:hypothetical protein [Candidatus Eremiobacteraeota bacterium]MBC5826422.1 hypothetical protein [Candidatus Eremiobacteraeota bacterium]